MPGRGKAVEIGKRVPENAKKKLGVWVDRDVVVYQNDIQRIGPFDEGPLFPGEEVGTFLRVRGQMHKEVVVNVKVED